jgi:hypothetical protein
MGHARAPGVELVPPPPDRPEYYLPNDGHPTALGNRAFAETLAAALERTARFASAVRANP